MRDGEVEVAVASFLVPGGGGGTGRWRGCLREGGREGEVGVLALYQILKGLPSFGLGGGGGSARHA